MSPTRCNEACRTELKNTMIPANVEVAETRNYGATANDKAIKLIQKLIFATLSVVALVFLPWADAKLRLLAQRWS